MDHYHHRYERESRLPAFLRQVVYEILPGREKWVIPLLPKLFDAAINKGIGK
jgi:hypothetical protein